jgi:hypothetical protein
MKTLTFVWYNNSDGSSSDYAWLPGHWLSEQEPPGEGSMYYQDSFGVQVVGGDFDPQAPMKRLPEYVSECQMTADTVLLASFNLWDWIKGLVCGKPKPKKPKPKRDPVYEGCLAICNAYVNYCRGLPPPGSSLCQIIAKKGCQAMCKDIRDTKYFDDCATPCKGFETDAQCMDCCAKMCEGKGLGSTKMCHKVCERDLFEWR